MRKKTILLLTVLFLFLVSIAGCIQLSAQLSPPVQPNRPTPVEQQILAQESQQRWKDKLKDDARRLWDSRTQNYLFVAILQFPEIRTALEVSDEQYRQILDDRSRFSREMAEHPETQKLEEAIRTLVERTSSAPELLRFPPMRQFFDAETWEQLQSLHRERDALQFDAQYAALGDVLPPEQRKKLDEALLANMRELPIVSISRFDTLDLTDGQREQLQAFEKEFEPELEKHLESLISSQLAYQDRRRVVSAMHRGSTPEEESRAVTQAVWSDPEFLRLFNEHHSYRKAFAERFTTEVRERGILTAEQWARFRELFDNPPEHVRVVRRQLRIQNGEGVQVAEEERAAAEGDTGPGAGSWRPGDALPVQIQRREGRFPREEE